MRASPGRTNAAVGTAAVVPGQRRQMSRNLEEGIMAAAERRSSAPAPSQAPASNTQNISGQVKEGFDKGIAIANQVAKVLDTEETPQPTQAELLGTIQNSSNQVKKCAALGMARLLDNASPAIAEIVLESMNNLIIQDPEIKGVIYNHIRRIIYEISKDPRNKNIVKNLEGECKPVFVMADIRGGSSGPNRSTRKKHRNP
jgi:hypothetical protein